MRGGVDTLGLWTCDITAMRKFNKDPAKIHLSVRNRQKDASNSNHLRQSNLTFQVLYSICRENAINEIEFRLFTLCAKAEKLKDLRRS